MKNKCGMCEREKDGGENEEEKIRKRKFSMLEEMCCLVLLNEKGEAYCSILPRNPRAIFGRNEHLLVRLAKILKQKTSFNLECLDG